MDFYEYVYNNYQTLFYTKSKISVNKTFHGQMSQIRNLLNSDSSSLISVLLDFMINSGNVDIDFQTADDKLNNILAVWKKTVNKNVSVDIPMGLRSFTTQYLRERWKSSFIVLRIIWDNVDGYILPTKMWLMDGSCIHAKQNGNGINTIDYYFGKPDKSAGNKLIDTENKSLIIRKPYCQWYDILPKPYLAKNGALYHALFKEELLSRQGELITSSFPYQLFIKMGTEQAIKKGLGPKENDLRDVQEKFKSLNNRYDNYNFNKGTLGAFPGDVNFEELIPDYEKGLKEGLTKAADKNILSSMGMIELRGFSSNREEAILNPKVMVEEINDGVLDYVEILEYVVELIKEKNKENGKYKFNKPVTVVPGIIKSFVTDEMRTLIRSWYDRGLVSQKDGLENTTGLNFEQQVISRDRERKLNLDERMYPRIVQNNEKDVADLSPNNENVPDDKKKGSPEANNYKNAKLKDENDIPKDFVDLLTSEEKEKFIASYNKKIDEYEFLNYDYDLKLNLSLQYACSQVLGKELNLFKAVYNDISELPDTVKNNMSEALQKVFLEVVNDALESGDSEESAFKQAWAVIRRIGKKNKNDKWVKK